MQKNHIPLRLLYVAVGVASFLILYSAGASIQMSRADAEGYANEYLERVKNINQNDIFANNIMAALGMFIPAFGAGFGGYSAISTGIMFQAIATINHSLEGISPLMVLATPFGVLEVVAYGVAMSRSGILVYDLVKRKPWRQYVYVTGIEIAFVTMVLLSGALIEGQAIDAARQ